MIEYRIRWHDAYFQPDRVFEFAGKRYRCHADDLATLRFLERLELDRMAPEGSGSEQPPQPPQLISLRREFRGLVADQPIAGLILCLVHGNVETRRLSLWLLGRCGNSKAIPALRMFSTHCRRDVRLAAVQALHRLRARAELAEVAVRDPDAWIRQYAAAATGRSFKVHLERFLQEDARRVTLGAQAAAPMPLVWNVSDFAGTPPKPPHLIRAILDRIRRLLRGNGIKPT